MVAGVETSAETIGGSECCDSSWRRQKRSSGGILGVYPNLDRVPVDFDVVLGERQFFTSGNADLLFYEINAGDHLSCWMLDLETSVHFQVVETAVFIQELDRSCIDVIAALSDLDGRFTHRGDDVGIYFWRWCFFDEFLVSALHRTIASSEVDTIAVLVRQNLDFHMAWLGEIALHVTLVAPEIRKSLSLGSLKLLGSIFGAVHDLHASPTASESCLYRNRPTLRIAKINDLAGVGYRLGSTGNAEHADSLGGFAARDLVAHNLDCGGVWSDECDPAFGYGARESGVFGEKSVAGVHRIGTAAFNDVKDCVGVEVGLSAGLPA